jgi:predicted small secreted protein
VREPVNPDAPEKRNNIMVKKLVLALVAGGIVFSASACNTVKGAGRDVTSVGKAGEDAIK